MIRFLLPIIFLSISAAVFFLYIDTEFKDIEKIKQEEQLFSGALDNSKKLQAIRDDILAKYNSFPADDLSRLEKMLPNHIDNVRLIRDIDGIASKYGMTLRNVSIDVGKGKSENLGPDDTAIGVMTLGFLVSGPYKIFLSFIKDLEKSMRVVDIIDVSFVSSDKDLYEYKIVLKTYWLK